MKKRHLLVVLFALLGWTQARADVKINATNFPDQNFRYFIVHELLEKEYSYLWDGRNVITDDLIAQVTAMDVSKEYIYSLKGIEFFTALTWLKCNGTSMTELNVSGCTELKVLQCSDNDQLTTLYASGCSKLESLLCGNNPLTTLNISGCTALRDLNCTNNKLFALHVFGCSKLEGLYCNNNQLSALDVSGCTALTQLSCGNNQLTALNVSGCTALTSLYCNKNQLTSLDVSGCPALTSLYCNENQLTALNVSGCTSLQVQTCSYNQLTTLNVSECTALTQLSCSNNQLTALDVSGCPALTSLYCNDNQLTSLDVSNNTALEVLSCYNNHIYGAAMDTFIASLCYPFEATHLQAITTDLNEGNVITTTQVGAFNEKRWNPMIGTYMGEKAGYARYKWEEYAGSDPTDIESIESDASASKNGSDVYFDLSGRRVMAPQKGVYVKNGKKVVVK